MELILGENNTSYLDSSNQMFLTNLSVKFIIGPELSGETLLIPHILATDFGIQRQLPSKERVPCLAYPPPQSTGDTGAWYACAQGYIFLETLLTVPSLLLVMQLLCAEWGHC